MASLNITRNPGESEGDFQRRYCREKMRIYRAAKPKGPRRFRGKGKAPKSGALYTAEEWTALMQRPDETTEEWNRRKQREAQRRHRRRNPGRGREAARERYAANRAAEAARNARYRAENRDKIKAQQREYFLAHKDKRLADLRAWSNRNPERYAEVKKAWHDNNPALRAAYSAGWRRACREQTPAWADFDAMLDFYREARRLTDETGIPHHVDHIIPLRGRTVRGLHVHTNLRVIPASENMRKRNRLDEALLEAA